MYTTLEKTNFLIKYVEEYEEEQIFPIILDEASPSQYQSIDDLEVTRFLDEALSQFNRSENDAKTEEQSFHGEKDNREEPHKKQLEQQYGDQNIYWTTSISIINSIADKFRSHNDLFIECYKYIKNDEKAAYQRLDEQLGKYGLAYNKLIRGLARQRQELALDMLSPPIDWRKEEEIYRTFGVKRIGVSYTPILPYIKRGHNVKAVSKLCKEGAKSEGRFIDSDGNRHCYLLTSFLEGKSEGNTFSIKHHAPPSKVSEKKALDTHMQYLFYRSLVEGLFQNETSSGKAIDAWYWWYINSIPHYRGDGSIANWVRNIVRQIIYPKESIDRSDPWVQVIALKQPDADIVARLMSFYSMEDIRKFLWVQNKISRDKEIDAYHYINAMTRYAGNKNIANWIRNIVRQIINSKEPIECFYPWTQVMVSKKIDVNITTKQTAPYSVGEIRTFLWIQSHIGHNYFSYFPIFFRSLWRRC